MKDLSCKHCTSKPFCRSKSITKGSKVCDEHRGKGSTPPRLQKEPNDSEKRGLLWYMLSKMKGGKRG